MHYLLRMNADKRYLTAERAAEERGRGRGHGGNGQLCRTEARLLVSGGGGRGCMSCLYAVLCDTEMALTRSQMGMTVGAQVQLPMGAQGGCFGFKTDTRNVDGSSSNKLPPSRRQLAFSVFLLQSLFLSVQSCVLLTLGHFLGHWLMCLFACLCVGCGKIPRPPFHISSSPRDMSTT